MVVVVVVSADLHACVEDVSSVRRHDRERERGRERDKQHHRPPITIREHIHAPSGM